MFRDILINLISEAIVMLITVLIINRLIERNEARRWKPAKSMFFARLFGTLDNFLGVMLHPDFLKVERGAARFYQFGSTTVYTNGRYGEIPTDVVEKAIQEEGQHLLETSSRMGCEALKEIKESLELILASSLPLAESDLMAALFELQNELASLVRFRKDGDLDEEAFAYALMRTLVKAIILRGKLEKKADKFVLADEYLRDVAVDGKTVFG